MPEEQRGRKEEAEFLYKAAHKFLAIRNAKVTDATFAEVHLSDGIRADVLNITWKELVTVIELKSCRADFKADKKWQKYLDYCDYFWFMCPPNAIRVDELPPKVGLVYVTGEHNNPNYQIVKGIRRFKPKKLTNAWFRHIWKKMAFRKIMKVNKKIMFLDDERFFE